MPVIIPGNLPAYKTMGDENIFVMSMERAEKQDIRPLEIALVNLMPTKIETETQFVRLLSNSPIQINVEFIHTSTYESKNISESHMRNFYKLQKKELHTKMFGVFEHEKSHDTCMLLNGFDDTFYVPHSRHTEILSQDIKSVKELIVLAESKDAGVHIAATNDYRKIFIMGHSEYDPMTLKKEYDRDISQGKPINIPKNYYPDDDPSKPPFVKWRGHANLLFKNWINVIYQETPYDINKIGK